MDFPPREIVREKGDIGLWAVREAVQRNSGTVSVDVDRKTGFGLILEFPTEG